MDDKLKREIHEVTERHIERYYTSKYEAMSEIEDNIRRASCDIFANQKRIMDRIEEIEKLIQSHAIGVQNVYDKFNNIFEELENKKNDDEEFRLEMAEYIRKRFKKIKV